MTTFKFEPTNGLWAVFYETTYASATTFTMHGGGTLSTPASNNFSICSIYSVKNGVHTSGLLPEAQALGLYGYGSDAHMTLQTMKAKAVATECNMYIYETGVSVSDLNDSSCDVLTYTIGAHQVIVDNVGATIQVRVAHDTVVTALVPTFTLSNGSTAGIAAVSQVSGVTEVNLSSSKDFLVTSAGGVTHKHFRLTAVDCIAVLTPMALCVIKDAIGGATLATKTPLLVTGATIASEVTYYYGVAGDCVADASDDVNWIITITSPGVRVMPNFVTLYECGWTDEASGALETASEGAYIPNVVGDELFLVGNSGWNIKEAAENNLWENYDSITFHDAAPKGVYTISRTLWDVSPAKVLTKAYNLVVTVV